MLLALRLSIVQSSATTKALTDTIIACNSLAMSALGRGDTLRCKELLARAFKIACYKRSHNGDDYDGDDYDGDDFSEPGAGGDRSGAVAALQVLTLNNTACLHRRYVVNGADFVSFIAAGGCGRHWCVYISRSI